MQEAVALVDLFAQMGVDVRASSSGGRDDILTSLLAI